MSQKASAVSKLNPIQLANARAIISVGQQLGMPEKAWVIALCVAMQESDLGANPAAARPNSDGDAGVFQQRTLPGWYGTLEQVNNIQYAATVFYTGKRLTHNDVRGVARAAGPAGYTIPGLMQIRGWENMPVTVAAQAVQRSAFPGAYAKHEPIARALVAELASGAASGGGSAPIPPSATSPKPPTLDGKNWLFIIIGAVLIILAIVRLTGLDSTAKGAVNAVVSGYTKGLVNVK